jgi:hypothetical protein
MPLKGYFLISNNYTADSGNGAAATSTGRKAVEDRGLREDERFKDMRKEVSSA